MQCRNSTYLLEYLEFTDPKFIAYFLSLNKSKWLHEMNKISIKTACNSLVYVFQNFSVTHLGSSRLSLSFRKCPPLSCMEVGQACHVSPCCLSPLQPGFQFGQQRSQQHFYLLSTTCHQFWDFPSSLHPLVSKKETFLQWLTPS